MGLNICIDVGNTRTKVAEFEERRLVQTYVLANNEVAKNSMMLDEMPIDALILSSVNKKVSDTLSLKDKSFPTIILDHTTLLPIEIKYQTPETLGKDRIALAVGANAIFPAARVLAIDAGTCITYDLINKGGEYLGGAISPGIQMRLKAMHFGTGSLPLIDWNSYPDHSYEAIGTTTISSMISGVINGIIGEINEFIDKSADENDNLRIVMTGGDADFFEKALKNGIFADPNLVLKGLNEILLYNLHNENGLH